MQSVYVPTHRGVDALSELDHVAWAPITRRALPDLHVPEVLAKLAHLSLDVREDAIFSLEYSADFRSETDNSVTAHMIPFLLAVSADSTAACRRETMRTVVLACEYAVKAQRVAVPAAAEASERWLQVVRRDESDAVAYGAKLLFTIRSDMTAPDLPGELGAVSTVLSNQAYNEALDEDERTRPHLTRADATQRVNDFDWTHADVHVFAMFLAKECNRAGAFDLTLQMLEKVPPTLRREALPLRFNALIGLQRPEEATKLAHKLTREWFAPNEEQRLAHPQIVSMLAALCDPTSVALLARVKAKARREILEGNAHDLMKAHLIELWRLD